MIWFVESWIWFLGALLFCGYFFWWMQSMWVVSCRRQGMLAQGPAPDPKCKLNISSFLTLPHLLDCLICTRNSVSIVLLLWMMGGWDRWGWLIHLRVWVGDSGWVLSLSLYIFFFLFVLLSFGLSCPYLFFKWVEHDSCCVCFYVDYLFPLSLVPLTRSYWDIEIVVSVM